MFSFVFLKNLGRHFLKSHNVGRHICPGFSTIQIGDALALPPPTLIWTDRWGSEQRQIQKRKALRCLEPSVLWSRNDKAHTSQCLLSNPSIDLALASPLSNITVRRLNFSTWCSGMPLICSVHWLDFMERQQLLPVKGPFSSQLYRTQLIKCRGYQPLSEHVPLQHFDRWARTVKFLMTKRLSKITKIH